MAVDEVEAAFRAQMRALAQKGGAVTKRRHGDDSRYYRDIGRLGGAASAAARRARIAAQHGAAPAEATIVDPPTPLPEVPLVRARARVTFKDTLADIERGEPRAPDVDRRQSAADLQAERNFERWLAEIRDKGSDDVEPWDPWSSCQ